MECMHYRVEGLVLLNLKPCPVKKGLSKNTAQVRMQSWWLARRPSGYGQQSFIDSHGLELRGVNALGFEAQGLGIRL